MSKTKEHPNPASKHLNSKVLFAEFKKLTTKAQLTQGERGDISEMTEIINSIRIPETDPHRLGLAEQVLSGALKMLEFEISLDLADKLLKEERKEAAVREARVPQDIPDPGEFH